MLPQDQLECAVYRAAAFGDPSQGRSVSWGQLSSEVGQPNNTVLLNLLKYLSKEDLLELKKWVASVWEIYPDTTLTDEQYFFRGDFRLAITAPGQRRHEGLEQQQHIADSLDGEQAPGLPTAPHLDEVVFVSCGQYTEDEKNLGMALAGAISELTPYQGYFAENQNSLQGLSQHIFGALNRAVGLVAVMHHRGEVSTPSGSHIRASVWIEQEIAIAAFLTAQGRDFPVQLYVQKGIKREGAREQLRLKPFEFETDAEVIADFRSRLQTGAFALARHAAEIDLRATIGYRLLHKSGQMHRYELVVTVENAGTAPVDDYWTELSFPKSLMDMSGIIVGEEKSRETQTHRLFRVTGKDLRRTLYPGDRVNIMPIEYRMDSALFDNPAVRDETVEIAVFAVGMKRVRIQKKISELNEF